MIIYWLWTCWSWRLVKILTGILKCYLRVENKHIDHKNNTHTHTFFSTFMIHATIMSFSLKRGRYSTAITSLLTRSTESHFPFNSVRLGRERRLRDRSLSPLLPCLGLGHLTPPSPSTQHGISRLNLFIHSLTASHIATTAAYYLEDEEREREIPGFGNGDCSRHASCRGCDTRVVFVLVWLTWSCQVEWNLTGKSESTAVVKEILSSCKDW